MSKTENLQHGFSAMHSQEMYDQTKRETKAKKALTIIQDYAGDLSKKKHLDIGCSTGFMTKLYSDAFADSTGIDIDAPAVEHAQKKFSSSKLRFLTASAMETGLPSHSYDVITCSQIYEHVPNAQKLVDEIHRLLKEDGVCYFAAGNRFTWMEEHYKLPLLSAIPKALAHPYIRMAGKADSYYETHYSLWGLKKLLRNFEVIDYTYRVLKDPARFYATDMLKPGSLAQKLILWSRPLTFWLVPTYLYILKPKKTH